MSSIVCPHCHESFELKSSDYLNIVGQVRTAEFEREVAERGRLIEQQKDADVAKVTAQAEAKSVQESAAHDKELARKDQKIALLEERLQNEEQRREAAVRDAVATTEADKIRHEAELARLRAELESVRTASEQSRALAVSEATGELRERIATLEGTVRQKEAERSEVEARLREQLGEAQKSQTEIVRIKDEEIERLKDYRLRLTVKMTGESLEQHCQQEFNRWRSQDPKAFQHIYFEKDNEAVEGTKGDFVYRETDEDGTEVLSIMFEMKNEELSSTNKKTNESHLAKLDRDRTKKGCEYAVLVSMLELDSEYYNQGIVDMSYRYDKMYVVRPQFFMLIIALLRGGAQKSVELRRQIAQMQNEQIDITNFEGALGEFQDKFGRNVELANKKFNAAIDEIDKTISHLQKVKENLLGSQNNLRLADDKAQKLSIKRLTKNSPLLAERFQELHEE